MYKNNLDFLSMYLKFISAMILLYQKWGPCKAAGAAERTMKPDDACLIAV
jgi:hypothetical protein